MMRLTRYKESCEKCKQPTGRKETCPRCGANVPLVNYVVLVSLSRTPVHVQRIGRSYHFPAVAQGREWVGVEIEDTNDHKVTLTDNPMGGVSREFTPFPVSCEQLAKDILHAEFRDDYGQHGAFIAADQTPTEEELTEGKQRRLAWLTKLVQRGDEMFGQLGPRGIAEIPEVMKRAVNELGERRDWVFTAAAERVQCEGCGTMLSKLADGRTPATCSNCGGVLNEELARKVFPHLFARPAEQEPEPVGPKTAVRARSK